MLSYLSKGVIILYIVKIQLCLGGGLRRMEKGNKLVLVEESVLPEVFKKVLYAKKLLSKDIANNLSNACKLAELSRSAFYKYKDCVSYYDETDKSTVTTLYCRLNDEPGVLSAVLSKLYKYEANVLTVNQNIPVDTVAVATIVIRTGACSASVEDILVALREVYGVVSAKAI